VVCCPQHKGKIAIYTDPNICQVTAISSTIFLNKQHIKVLDLNQCTEVVVKIKWQYIRDWAMNVTDTVANLMVGSSITYNSGFFEAVNGFLTIFPLTRLQVPNGTSGCYINVFVRCPNLQLTQPTNIYIPTKRILYQSGMTSAACDKCCFDPEVTVLNPNNSMEHDCCENMYGEQLISYHALLSRFEQALIVAIAADVTTLKSIYTTWPILMPPHVYGFTSTDNTLLTYLRMMHLGMHGGVKYRFRTVGLSFNDTDNLTVLLNQPESVYNAPSSGVLTDPAAMNFTGGVTFVPRTNGGIEFEVPYYTSNQFALAQTPDMFTSVGGATYIQPNATRRVSVRQDCAGANTIARSVVEIARAEDFRLLRALAPAPYGI